MIKLCVFDLDGTLVDSLRDIADSTNFALKKNGFPQHDLHEYPDFICDGLPALIRQALGNNYSPEASLRLTADFTCYYNSHFDNHTRPYQGMTELLNNIRAHDIKLAVLSNKPDHFVKVIMDKMYPDVVFQKMQGKSDLFPQKPAPDSLLYILEKLEAKVDETIYIGDSNVDVFTAQNAGVKAIGVTWGFRTRQELEEAGADYIVESPHDIMPLIIKL